MQLYNPDEPEAIDELPMGCQIAPLKTTTRTSVEFDRALAQKIARRMQFQALYSERLDVMSPEDLLIFLEDEADLNALLGSLTASEETEVTYPEWAIILPFTSPKMAKEEAKAETIAGDDEYVEVIASNREFKRETARFRSPKGRKASRRNYARKPVRPKPWQHARMHNQQVDQFDRHSLVCDE